MKTETTAGLAAPSLREEAWAKINLCLHVTGQRQDGYHLLDSLVAFAGVGDVVTVQSATETHLSLAGPFGAALPVGGDNLVLRAARLLTPDLPVALHLEKHLPPSSGIGGGSADAAATLRLMARLQGRSLDWAALSPEDKTVITCLGADIPVCLTPRPTRMRGIGEDLTPVEGLPEAWLLLVNPRVEVPTPAVFRALSRKDNPPLPESLPAWADAAALAAWLAVQRNDLEAPARQIAPVITEVLDLLASQQGSLIARMSGSGATCFALFEGKAEAQAAEAAILRDRSEWWAKAGPLLGASA